MANAVAALSEIDETSKEEVFKINSENLKMLLAALNECTEYAFIEPHSMEFFLYVSQQISLVFTLKQMGPSLYPACVVTLFPPRFPGGWINCRACCSTPCARKLCSSTIHDKGKIHTFPGSVYSHKREREHCTRHLKATSYKVVLLFRYWCACWSLSTIPISSKQCAKRWHLL